MKPDIREVLAPTRSAPDDVAGRIDKYRVLDEIGQGGMSIVYRARDERLQRDVAIKVMHRHLARDPEARTRFSREARAVARLAHRHIPEIYDFSSSEDDVSYLVSELVDGRSLASLLDAETPLLPEQGVMLVVGVARALSHAHAHGIIHRDVKPENILVGRDGVVQLTDFGIAQIIGLESMTMTGTLIGSPAHMAPEQIDGTRDLDYRVDVWALGTVLYMAVTGGAPPFAADNPHGVLKRISEGEFVDPRRVNPHVDSELAAIIARCLRVDRGARYATIEEVRDDLDAWLEARGLNAVETEVRGLMADPEGYRKTLTRRLTLTMMALGDEALAERSPHRALERFGRVLTLDPDHPEAFDRVRKLSVGMRHRRLLRRAALVAGAAIAAALGIWAFAEATSPPAAPTPGSALVWRAGAGVPPLAASTSPPAITARAAEPVSARAPEPAPVDVGASTGAAVAASAARAFELRARRARATRPIRRPPRQPSPPEAAETVAVTLSVSPPAVRISVDGEPFVGGATRPLPPGTHAVTLSHPVCEKYHCLDDVRTLAIEPGAAALSRHFEFTFRYPSATLEIQCSSGNYALDREGNKYECGTRHTIAVTSHERATLWLQLYDASGEAIESRRGVVVRPGVPIEL